MKIKFYCPNCEGLIEVESHEIENCINPYQREWDYGSNLLCEGCVANQHEVQELAKKMINFNEMRVEIKLNIHVPINTNQFIKEVLEDRYITIEPKYCPSIRVCTAKKYIIEDPNYRILPNRVYKDLEEKYGEGIGYFEDENLDKWEVKSQFMDTTDYNLFRYYQNESD